MQPHYFVHASPAQRAYLVSLGARGLNTNLGHDEAILIASNLAYSRAGRALGTPTKQGRIPRGEV